MKKAILLSAFAGICVSLILKFFIIDIFHVCGQSMEPTLSDGCTVFANKIAYGLVKPFSSTLIVRWSSPQTDDIVIYMHESNLVIKRCAAIAGSLLDYSKDNGYTLNVNGHSYPLTKEQFNKMRGIDKVPDGTILALGDNPGFSIDSRDYGFIPVYNVLGKALCN